MEQVALIDFAHGTVGQGEVLPHFVAVVKNRKQLFLQQLNAFCVALDGLFALDELGEEHVVAGVVVGGEGDAFVEGGTGLVEVFLRMEEGTVLGQHFGVLGCQRKGPGV